MDGKLHPISFFEITTTGDLGGTPGYHKLLLFSSVGFEENFPYSSDCPNGPKFKIHVENLAKKLSVIPILCLSFKHNLANLRSPYFPWWSEYEFVYISDVENYLVTSLLKQNHNGCYEIFCPKGIWNKSQIQIPTSKKHKS